MDGLLERGNLTEGEREQIESQCAGIGRSMPELLEEATGMISGLSRCAGLVVAPKVSEPLKHIEFVSLGPGRALVVLVMASGAVENRVIDVPMGLPPSSLVEASNYLSSRLVGRTLGEASTEIERDLREQRAMLDELTSRVVESGLATWAPSGRGEQKPFEGALILKGQSQLLEDINAIEDLERIRQLFKMLETKESSGALAAPHRCRRRRSHIHRRRERALLPCRLLHCDRALQQHPATNRRRHRCHWPDSHRLCPDNSNGGLHRQGDLPDGRLRILVRGAPSRYV